MTNAPPTPTPDARKYAQRMQRRGYWHVGGGKPWRAMIYVNGTRIDLGAYATPQQARAAFENAATYFYGPPDSGATPPGPRRIPKPKLSPEEANIARLLRARGYSYITQKRRWMVQLRVGGTSRYIGTYTSPQEARAAWERAVERYFGRGVGGRAG